MNRMRIEKDTKFSAVKKAYQNVNLENCKSLTQYVDSLLFKSITTAEILALVIEAKEVKFSDSKDFSSLARIQSHINYRANHDHLAVSKSKAAKQRYTKLLTS